MATVIVLQTLQGLSDREAVEAVTFDLRWKAACGLPVTARAFHADDVDVLAAPVGGLGPAATGSSRRSGGGGPDRGAGG